MSLRWKINRLRAMSFREVSYRGACAIRSRLERYGIGLATPGIASSASGKGWVTKLPHGFNVQRYRDAAERIVAGQFRVFAMDSASIGFPPQWNRDVKTGISAPLAFGKSLNYRDECIVGNIKYLWEPNRHLELVTLAQAWHLTRDERYTQAAKLLVDSWMSQCPYPRGPNWTSSLELAIRLINWTFAWHLLGGDRSPIFDGNEGAAFRKRWLDCIYCHCHFIDGHLSLYSSANNHLLGELLGLFVASITWPRWTQSDQWLKRAQRRLEAEVLLQNSADGVNKEQGIWYHHEVADMMLIAGLFGRASGREFSRDFWQRWESMLEFVASVMDVGGHVPAIGDSDDAVIVRLNPSREFDAYRSLLATGTVLLGRSDFKLKGTAFDDKTRWLLGDGAMSKFNSRPAAVHGLPVKRAFSEGGYYILGSDFETAEEVRIVADAGPLGYLAIAAHGHADALSFTLSVAGRPILIDPGTYAYHTEKKWRNYFRGTSAHNTIRVDGQDQSVSGGNFMWTAHARAVCEKFETNGEHDLFTARHSGYERLRDPVVHRRELIYCRDARILRVVDTIESKASHNVEIYWHFSELCEVIQVNPQLLVRNGEVALTMCGPAQFKTEVISGCDIKPLGWVSRSFDVKIPCATAMCSGRIEGRWQGVTEIAIRYA